MDEANLKGKVAVIIGGAFGVGREAPLALAQQGVEIAFCDMMPVETEKVSKEIIALGHQDKVLT